MGAISPGRWQFAQFLKTMGATSLEKVGMAADAAHALPVAHQASIQAHHARSLICRFLVVMMSSHYYNLATKSQVVR